MKTCGPCYTALLRSTLSSTSNSLELTEALLSTRLLKQQNVLPTLLLLLCDILRWVEQYLKYRFLRVRKQKQRALQCFDIRGIKAVTLLRYAFLL